MHDPYYAGSVTLDDFYEHFTHQGDRYGVLRLQGTSFGVRLRLKGDRGDDQLIADRLKHMFDLIPLNTAIVSLDDVDYFMMEAPFTCEGDEIRFTPPIQLDEYEEEWYDNHDFRREVCKIYLFRWIIGCKDIQSHIEVWNGWSVSASEPDFNLHDMGRDTIDDLCKIYSDVLDEAIDEMIASVDFNDLRGCLAQKREPLMSIDRLRVGKKYNVDVRALLRSMEVRIDILETMSGKDFLTWLSEPYQ